jgi:glyoxylase-like metal-dependent hydrolase (beta-lactamase superfamily II)
MDQNDATGRCAIYAFPPNRDTLGGTAYLIVDEVNILVDCPAWDEANQAFLKQQGGVRWLFLTHRGAISKVREIQQTCGCEVVIQEQEAYLLPGLTVTPFARSLTLTPQTRAIWTPGHSPGSACLYYNRFGGVLFSGRHLLPNPQGKLMPLKTSNTFHWQRQTRSVEALVADFTPETLAWVCPGANLGFLRGKQAVEQAYTQLAEIRS